MKIVVPFKVVADDQDIIVASDESLDFSRAHKIVSTYDLNALEAASQIATTEEGSSVVAITVGDASIDDSKLKKNVLARGASELFMTADDACGNLDAFATSLELVKLLAKVGPYDLIVCGDGSSDVYAQQVEVQLAECLDLPCITAVCRIEANGASIVVDRMLETEIETLEVTLPAVISVVPDSAVPRICGMKDILAAGKKPSNVFAADDATPSKIEVIEEKAPKRVARKLEIFDATTDGDIDKFVAALKAAL
ncbi:MAG: electron transfer flavoprotein [Raoultibacter sp.]